MVSIVTPPEVPGAKELREAHLQLMPVLRDLPTTEQLFFTDQPTRAALKAVADWDAALFTTYMDVVRSRCGRNVARMLSELAGGRLPDGRGHPLRVLTAGELVNHDLPPLEPILKPWLYQKNLAMVHAKRGVGKTHLALAVAFAVASGGTFLSYRAPRPRGVLYLDGEMPGQLMQKRLSELMGADGVSPDLLRIVTPDLQDKPMPDLGTLAGQREVDALVDDETALIIVDNLSCLVRSGGAENESESWSTVAEWALNHRRSGRAVFFVHHSGKSGAQRGTSKREDLLDVVINLRRPAEYSETDGAVFEVIFEKARSLRGQSVEPVEARLMALPNGQQEWVSRAVEDVSRKTVVELWNGGVLTLADIVRETGRNKSTVHRQLVAAMEAGSLTRQYPQQRRARQ